MLFAYENNTLSFSGSGIFGGNTAKDDGGALYAEEDSTWSFSAWKQQLCRKQRNIVVM